MPRRPAKAPATPVPPPTCIDLFCGCGGFTLGMMRAGFEVLAAVDFDEKAIGALRDNLATRPPKGLLPVKLALQADLTALNPRTLSEQIKADHVDVIVGGPPCQGFSTARMVDGSNHGPRLKEDKRRFLYQEFLRFVEFFRPKVFVMENVLGIRSAAGGEYFERVLREARELGRKNGGPGYRVQSRIEDAFALGVPQKRRRQLFVGVRADQPGFLPLRLAPAPNAIPGTTLGDAIMDLPELRAGRGDDIQRYDKSRRRRFALRRRVDGFLQQDERRYAPLPPPNNHAAGRTPEAISPFTAAVTLQQTRQQS